ncbi:hypothetical protein HYALB_00001530 [Hymenoscyphus albidus]|uniref:Uncharacterized protein n=1 Tax=Hymenoscyphus albidus TaxID=595503 RepID=A0A9N9LDQ0_9HELO|nr:hypothetical protein HYALB_00001530 [Hymenoscyphus albidus]
MSETVFFLKGGPLAERGSEWATDGFGGNPHILINRWKRKRRGYFGFHHFTWPTLNDWSLESKPRILLQPPLSDEKVYRPMTVYMLEQMQQRYFWEFAVRRYGIKRVLEANNTRTFARSLVGLPWGDITAFEKEANDMISKLAELSPEERNAASWARRFVRRTVAVDQFWSVQNEEMSSAVAETTPKFKKGRRRGLLVLLPWPRRLPLAIWNRGTRMFLRRLNRNKLSGEEYEGARKVVDDLLINLECAKMIFCKPTDMREDEITVEGLRIAFQDAISGDENVMRLALDRLDGPIIDPRTSVFLHSCAEVLYCTVSPDPLAKLVDRIQGAFDNLDGLRLAFPGESCPPVWDDLIKKWIQLAQKVRQGVQLDPEERPVDRSEWLGKTFPAFESGAEEDKVPL